MSNKEDVEIKPTKKVEWIAGLKVAFASLGAKQKGQYSWVAKSEESYVFTAEIDHVDKENNVYNHGEGVFTKNVPPTSKENGDATVSISHAQDLFDAVTDALANELRCRLLLVKGTKSGKDIGGIKAAADGDSWQVSKVDGTVAEGFGFTIIRVE